MSKTDPQSATAFSSRPYYQLLLQWLFLALTATTVFASHTAVAQSQDFWTYRSQNYPTKAAALAAMYAYSSGNSVLTQESIASESPAVVTYQYSAPPVLIGYTDWWYCGSLNGLADPACRPTANPSDALPTEAADFASLQAGVASYYAPCTPNLTLVSDWAPFSNGNFNYPNGVGVLGEAKYWQTPHYTPRGSPNCIAIGYDEWPLFRERSPQCPNYYNPWTSYAQEYCTDSHVEQITHQLLECAQNGSASPTVGDPCDVSTGDFSQDESDYSGAGLSFQRYYHSAVLESHHTLGVGWTHSYAGYLVLTNGVPTGLLRPDGHHDAIQMIGTSYESLSGAGIHIQHSGSDWTAYLSSGALEVYGPTGQLMQEVTPAGLVTTMAYNASGQIATVTGPFGHSLQFAYDGNGRLTQVTEPDGSSTITFAYDSNNNLISATYPDGTVRQYLYENSSFPNNLTGIVDESNARFLTVQYDPTTGAVTSSQQAGGAQAVSIVYGSNGAVVTDALNATNTYTFTNDPGYAPRLINVVRNGLTQSFAVPAGSTDPQRRVTQATDPNGNIATYSYDPDHLTSKTEAYGTPRTRTTSYQYLAMNTALPTLVTEALRQTSYSYYSGTNNVQTKTITDTTVSPNVSRTWTYTYDGYGRVLTVDGPRTDVADVTTYTYYTCTTGAQCGQVQTVSDAAGNATTYNAYNANGQPLTITDPNGVITILAYDLRQRLTSRTTSGEVTSFSYYPIGLVHTVTLPDGSFVQYTYDGAHRLTQVSDRGGNSTVYTLDAMGNRVAENTYDPGSVLHHTHSRVINALNQLYQDVNAAGTAAVTTTYAYDNNGNQTGIDAPLSRNTGNTYDELNRVNQVTDPESGVTQLAYDQNDNLTSVTDPRSLITSYRYDGFGDLVTQVSPDTGTTAKTYDSGGNLSTATDARGAVSSYTYDALSRVTSVAYSLSGTTDQTVAFTYDAGTNGKGHLTGASDANHSMSWGYDALGRAISKTQTVGSIARTVAYGYTNADLTSVTTPSGQTVGYGYNANHQITSVTVNGVTLLNNAAYEPFGPINGWTWGNGTATVRAYDADGNVSLVNAGGEANSYAYDDASRIASISNAANSNLSWAYGYDVMDRLNAANSTPWQETFTFDADGNRLTQGGSYASTFTISPTSNRIAGSSNYFWGPLGYDARGDVVSVNVSGEGPVALSYNAAGLMVQMKNAATGESGTVFYNALGQRIHKTSPLFGDTTFVYDEAGHLIGEYDDAGNLIEEMVWLGEVPVATLRPNGSGGVDVFYVHTDHLNTPRKITRPSDNAFVWRWDSDPFGNNAPNEDPSDLGTFISNLTLPGQYIDEDTGLSYNGARYYDPAASRYFESDPIGLKGGVNTYVYVNGNPLRFADPRGLIKWNGQVHGYGASAGVGASFQIYTLTSECKAGKQAWAKVYAVGPTAGADVEGLPPISFSYEEGVDFKDQTNVPDPNVFNGKYLSLGVGGSPMIGFSCSSTKLGGADYAHGGATSTDCGWSYGFDIGASVTLGTSTVIDSDVEDCPCEKAGRQ